MKLQTKVIAFSCAVCVLTFGSFVANAHAATSIFSESFGTGGTSSTVAGWSEGGAGAEVRQAGSGNDSASPEGGRFATTFGRDGYICRTIDTSGYTNVQLSYYWRGDSDSHNPSDDGIVEIQSARGNHCWDTHGWTLLKNHDLQNDGSWTTQSAFTNTGMNDREFLLRFRTNTNATDEHFRVDGIVITGDSVTPPNIAPIAAGAEETVAEDGSLSGTLVATDSDGPSALVYSIDSSPSHGLITSLDSATGEYTYEPALNFFGDDSFTFTATDGDLTSNTATVTLTVTPVNDTPFAMDDYYTVTENTPTTIGNVLENDTDVEGDELSVFDVEPITAEGGSVENNANGSFLYTPPTDFSGSDSFAYVVTDGDAQATATVHISVQASEDPGDDNQDPHVTSTSPQNGQSLVGVSTDVVITFSKAMDEESVEGAITFTTCDDEGDGVFDEAEILHIATVQGVEFSPSWSEEGTELTLAHEALLENTCYRVTIGEGADSVDEEDGPFAEYAFSFTVVADDEDGNGESEGDGGGQESSGGSSGGSGGGSGIANTIHVQAPTAQNIYQTGGTLPILWTTTGSAMNTIDVWFSPDAGGTYTLIGDNLPNSGEFDWSIPLTAASVHAQVKVDGTDGGVVLIDSATSELFTITPSGEVLGETDNGNGSAENGTVVVAGDFVVAPRSTDVYYIDTRFVRHPVIDAQTYFTYNDTWEDVVHVTDEELDRFPLGAPWLPKAGVVLVKVTSAHEVYALEANGEDTVIRLIPDEMTAEFVYGSHWKEYVIDIEPTHFKRFVSGENLPARYAVDMTKMKTRAYLNSK